MPTACEILPSFQTAALIAGNRLDGVLADPLIEVSDDDLIELFDKNLLQL